MNDDYPGGAGDTLRLVGTRSPRKSADGATDLPLGQAYAFATRIGLAERARAVRNLGRPGARSLGAVRRGCMHALFESAGAWQAFAAACWPAAATDAGRRHVQACTDKANAWLVDPFAVEVGEMAGGPAVPMRPDALPRQRLSLVTSLPPKPSNFDAWCPIWTEKEGRAAPPWAMLEDPFAPRFPGRARYLAEFEWAWSPHHTRLDALYLASNRARSHWFLWCRSHDDSDWPWRWRSCIQAYCPRPGISLEVAAVWLLVHAWSVEAKDDQLGMPDMINETAHLSVDQIKAIYREVWPQCLEAAA